MISFVRSSVFVLVAGVAAVSALNLNDIPLSKSCKSTILNMALEPEASSCFNAPAIINSVIDSTRAREDPIGTVKTWAEGLCSNGWCTSDTVANVLKNLTSACAEDMANFGVQIDLTPDTIKNVQDVYRTARQVLCLKDTTANDLCLISSINKAKDVFSQDGTVEAIMAMIKNGFSSGFTVEGVESALQAKEACTSCAKAAYSVARGAFTDIVSKADDQVANVCGADFVNGQIPADVQKTAVAVSAKELIAKKSAAVGLTSSSVLSIASVAFMAMLGLVL